MLHNRAADRRINELQPYQDNLQQDKDHADTYGIKIESTIILLERRWQIQSPLRQAPRVPKQDSIPAPPDRVVDMMSYGPSNMAPGRVIRPTAAFTSTSHISYLLTLNLPIYHREYYTTL